MVIPDIQAKHGINFKYLTKLGMYMVEKQPDIVVCLGDLADMPSLSSYDVGKKSFEGRRYTKDIEAAHQAQTALFLPLAEYQASQREQKKKQYSPRTIMCMGNHENRINKAINNDPKLEGLISCDDLGYGEWWDEIYDFLDTVVVEGIAFSHYFVTGVAGRPASTASAQMRKTNMSSIAGHQQGLQFSTASRADGARLTSVITGSCYQHSEDYLGPQGNNHFRGFLMLHDVKDGQFDLMSVSLSYLDKKYGN